MDYILIPGEREIVVKQQDTYLKEQWNLTGSHDGGTSRCKQAFWLQHISDADRNVFLVQAVDATGESHTAVWIADFVDRTIMKIGPEHFAGLVCDSTGNTLGSRTVMSRRHRIILIFPDACHHLSSQIKDIVKLPYFAGVIIIVRATLTFFHKSHAGIHAFAQARKDLKISRALDAIGKTRFASIIYSARSIQRNLLAFQRIFRRTNLNFDYQEEFEPMLRDDETGAPNLAAIEFQSKLGQLISIGLPAARVIACLESNYATPGDFYLLWHAMIGGTLDVVQSTSQNSRFPVEVQEKVRAIIHYRHAQVFSESGNLYTPAYLAAAYLNPGQYHLGALIVEF
ncbi:hypothetical protein BDZ89DRAFT_963490 [Hymenopellis radicata]|nr:hypothetical protein BDZ89DRAFT_963490 [Hymenopellis radicata]